MGKARLVQSPGPRNNEGHYYPWAWRGEGGSSRQPREGMGFVFQGPPGRSSFGQPTKTPKRESWRRDAPKSLLLVL